MVKQRRFCFSLRIHERFARACVDDRCDFIDRGGGDVQLIGESTKPSEIRVFLHRCAVEKAL